MKVIVTHALSIASLLAGLLVFPTTYAATIRAGDILIADTHAFGGNGGIFRVDPVTGTQETISLGGSFVDPQGIALDANGDLIIVDWSAFGGGGGVTRVNPTTGGQSTVSSGGSFVNPRGIAIAANGDLFISDYSAFGGGGGIIRVDPSTGAQTVVSFGGHFGGGAGKIAIDANGDIIVADAETLKLIRVNPATGAQTLISSGGSFTRPFGVAIEGGGDILVADFDAFGGGGGVIRVNPSTGAQTEVSSGGFFVSSVGIAIDANGNIIIADHEAFGGGGAIIRVDPITGAQTTVSSGGLFNDPHGIAIVPGFARVVSIDIKPGSDPNSINLSSAGVIPVAILSSDTFNAPTEVDPDTISLAGARVKLVGRSYKFLCHDEDVNADGLLDLVCQVETAGFMIEEGESMIVLEAETFNGIPIRGEDNVRIVPD